jgi:hypothetical protein
MDTPETKPFDAGQCPLCGQRNDCQRCMIAGYKGPCWCDRINFPEELLRRVPEELQNKVCICRACVTEFRES